MTNGRAIRRATSANCLDVYYEIQDKLIAAMAAHHEELAKASPLLLVEKGWSQNE